MGDPLKNFQHDWFLIKMSVILSARKRMTTVKILIRATSTSTGKLS